MNGEAEYVDDAIDAEYQVVDAEDDQEYAALLAALDAEPAGASGQGFDLTQVQGNPYQKTAKAIILHRTLCGWSVSELAEALEFPVATVSRYLADAIREASQLDDLDVVRKHELLKLSAREAICHKQFQRSCEDAVTVVEEVGPRGITTKTYRKGQSGNPAYMAALDRIAQHRDRLLGLAAPTRVEVNKQSKTLQITEIIVSTREEVEEARKAGLLKGPGE